MPFVSLLIFWNWALRFLSSSFRHSHSPAKLFFFIPRSFYMHISHTSGPSMASHGALDLTIAINSSSYGSSDSDLSAHASSPVQLDLLPHEPISRKLHMSRHIDVNQVPSVLESDDMAPYSQESLGFKRDREKFYDADQDRTCEISSRASDDEETGQARKKLRLTKEQSSMLEESFKEHITLNPKQKNALAKQLNLRPRQVEVWFQNRRARTKLKQTEVDCELLKRCCETLTEENRRLQKELQELRAIKVAPPCVIAQDFYMPLPAATLTMCPSCERLATTVDNRALGFVKPHFSQPSAAC